MNRGEGGENPTLTPAATLIAGWREATSEHPGIDVWLEPDVRHEHVVSVEAIWSNGTRRAGNASRAMRGLTEMADALGVTLRGEVHWLAYDTDNPPPWETEAETNRLEALNELRLGNAELLAWYRRLGFEAQGVVDEVDPLNVVVIRRPLRGGVVKGEGRP